MPKLILLDGPLGGSEVPLTETLTIGRLATHGLVLPDEGVSKSHARVELRGEEYALVDLESLNGSYVNRRRVRDHVLRHRDQVRIGSTRMLYVDPRQARQEAMGLSIPLVEAEPQPLDAETTAVFKLPDYTEPDDLGEFMEQFEKLHVAFRMGSELAGILDERELGRALLEKLFEILPAERGSFLLCTDQSSELSQVAVRDVRGEADSGRLDLSTQLVRAAAAKRVGVVVQDLTRDPRFAEKAGSSGARSALAVPLVSRGQLLGVLYLDNVHRPGAFSPEDMDLVLGVGAQAAAAVENLRLYEDIEGERAARERVSRYLSPNLVERVVRDDRINLGGEKAEITILFADLRGFTPLAESMPPDEVVVMLNEFFEIAVDLIFKYGGTLDKFIGDAVMAFWGVPVRRSIDPHLTVLTALKLQAEVLCLNERRRKLDRSPLGLGVGIHSGPAVAGNLGTQRRMDFTVIGDTVNVASRIQDLAGPGDVVVSAATRERMGDLLRTTRLPDTRLEGRRGTLDLYRVHGMYLQEAVAHEHRKVRRMQTALEVRLLDAPEGPAAVGVLVDLSPIGAGVLVEDGLRHLVEVGERLRVEVLPGQGPEGAVLAGEVAAVREVAERSGTVYLHAGLRVGEDDLPSGLREFFFG